MASKNYIIASAFIISLGIALGGLFVSNLLTNSKKLDRTVRVKGLAERQVEATVAVWPIQITVMSNSLSELQKILDEHSNLVSQFFIENGISTKEFKIGSPQIEDTQANSYNNNRSDNLKRYIAKLDFTIRTQNLVQLNQLYGKISAIIGQGVVFNSKNSWQPVEYKYTTLNEIKPEMIEEATKNARKAAEKFAVNSGSQVGKIKSAYQGVFSISNLDSNTPETKKIRVVSTVEFYLKD